MVDKRKTDEQLGRGHRNKVPKAATQEEELRQAALRALEEKRLTDRRAAAEAKAKEKEAKAAEKAAAKAAAEDTEDEEDDVPQRAPKGGKAKKAESALEQLPPEDRTQIMLFAGVQERL